ncbi:unannotated protein [freshwater metagenome]|uniref:Unannotated protein n=1 Tax=freshwater metagenome TaxID=449393 RepID=A0A6J7C635_9ZZZZ
MRYRRLPQRASADDHCGRGDGGIESAKTLDREGGGRDQRVAVTHVHDPGDDLAWVSTFEVSEVGRIGQRVLDSVRAIGAVGRTGIDR